jgi:PEP-CTERM motif
MKISQICAIFLMLVVGSVMAFADGINDPKIIVRGAGSGNIAQGHCEQCVDVGLNFQFSVPESGSGSLFFTNTSGQNWNSLTLIEKGEPAADIKCSSNLFSSCSVKTLKNGSVEIFLANVKNSLNRSGGIRNGQSFSIAFSCIKESCWPGGLTFQGHANAGTVPEPGTIALMVTGVVGLVSRRKVWKNRWNS